MLNLNTVDPSWQDCIQTALTHVDPNYLNALVHSSNWLPDKDKIFNAFSLPVDKVKYVLFGESPYPRKESANGFAFWDAAVDELWSTTGLSKKVNRATSLRNIIKMLLVAEGLLNPADMSQQMVANINKQPLVKTNRELFTHLLNHGFLLLNATPVLTMHNKPHKDARAWHPFTQYVLAYLLKQRPHIKLILLGNIAKHIDHLLTDQQIDKLYAEHPYNLSFIQNPEIVSFFKPFHLLTK